jgi:MFS family permease
MPPPIDTQKRNYLLLYLEAFLAPFTGIAGAFVGAYAIHLGASNNLIGLMNSLPSLLVVLVSIPFGRIMQTSHRKLFWALGGISLYRIGYMLFALAPLFTGTRLDPAVYLVGMFALVAVPIQFFNIGTVGLMIDLVPDNDRAAIFTNRSLISSLVSIPGVFLAGQWLNRHGFPMNYQVLFLVCGFLAFLNLFAWLGMRFPSHPVPKRQPVETPLESEAKPDVTLLAVEAGPLPSAPGIDAPPAKKNSLILHLQELTHVFRGQPTYTRFMINTLLLNVGMWLVGPLYVLYTVKELGASEAWIGLSSTVASISSLIGLMLGRKLVELWGDVITQRRLVLLLGLYPVLVGLSPSLSIILVVNGIYNLFTPGFSLANYSLSLKAIPSHRREDATAITNTATSIGAAIFPLLGVALSNFLGISLTLILCGLLALFGSLSFWIWKIKVD